ncbi:MULTISPECIES: rubrerythrin-like domain-containing protein [Natrialbaceae]|uniref:rubrerythrin-like domain-containing protein n=1 Tax=Natrialbaceae TaxID=1644061 RepID=UPI0031F32217
MVTTETIHTPIAPSAVLACFARSEPRSCRANRSRLAAVFTDPYTPAESHYECRRSGYRERTDSLGSCPDCDSALQNIAVPCG